MLRKLEPGTLHSFTIPDMPFNILVEVPRFEALIDVLSKEYPNYEIELIAKENDIATIIR